MKRQFVGSTAIFALLFGASAPAFAKPPSDVSDLVSSRAPGGETQMQSRGYTMAKFKGGAQYWWNSGTRTCARIVVANGRYASVDKTDASDCGHSDSGGGSSAGAAIAGVAAIGLIAALASHKKKHGNDPGGDHDSEYGRGYNDGLYGGQYDRHDSEGYHDGFMAGETEASNRRAANRPYARGARMRQRRPARRAVTSIRTHREAAASRSASAATAPAIMSSPSRPAIIDRPAPRRRRDR